MKKLLSKLFTKISNGVNNPDTFVILVIILVALITFGIGRLTSPKSEPIQIMNLEKASVEDIKPPEEGINEEQTYQGDYEGKVVGSINSDKYHLPDCPGAKQISEKNKIWFDSPEEAEKAGYKPAQNCPGLTQ